MKAQAINPNWKNEIRAHFASNDEVAYRAFKGVATPSLTEVKVEILNRRTVRRTSPVVASAISNLYRD